MILHGLLLSTEARWLKKKDSHWFRPKPLSITLSYQYPEKKISQGEKKPENMGRRKIHIPKKQKKAPVKPALQKKIQRTIKPQSKKSPKKIKPYTQEVVQRVSEPADKIRPQIPSQPNYSKPESYTERQYPEMSEKELDFSAVPTERGYQGTVLKAPPLSMREAIPVYRKNPSPKYPGIARRRGYEGTVVMEVLVNREGKVEDLRIFQSSGHPVLDRAAMKSVKDWLFESGRRGDKEVEMWVKIPVRFKLK